MPGIRFLERLRVTARNPDAREDDREPEVLLSVINHVSAILNTRQGSSLLDEDMGVPDFTSMGVTFTAADIPDIERRLAALIRRYEPRLTDVTVQLTSDTASKMSQLDFSLQARLRLGSKETLPVCLFTRFTSEGHVVVEN